MTFESRCFQFRFPSPDLHTPILCTVWQLHYSTTAYYYLDNSYMWTLLDRRPPVMYTKWSSCWLFKRNVNQCVTDCITIWSARNQKGKEKKPSVGGKWSHWDSFKIWKWKIIWLRRKNLCNNLNLRKLESFSNCYYTVHTRSHTFVLALVSCAFCF